MAISTELQAHLESGHTTLSRAWGIIRKDGVRLGFTDHDLDLSFEGFLFRADTGLSALSLSQSTGLSVDNTEALGALSDASVREDDIEAGRYDGAEVISWLVNWADTDQRHLQFRGFIGEMQRVEGGFRAELRGLTECLNRPLGRIYQKPCTAVLGDKACKFALESNGYRHEGKADEIIDRRIFRFNGQNGFEPGWFTRGRLEVLDGPAKGLFGLIKSDRFEDGVRLVELWEPIRGDVSSLNELRLDAGCDKRFETCRLKFNNLLNFQGFPDIPGDDWMAALPRDGAENTGGSRR